KHLWFVGSFGRSGVVFLQLRRRFRRFRLLAVGRSSCAVVRSRLATFQCRSSGCSILITGRNSARRGSTSIGKSQQPPLNPLKFRTADHILFVFRKSCGQSESRSSAVGRRRVARKRT